VQTQSLDESAIVMQAYDVGDLINASVEVADYIYWKQAKESDPEVQRLVKLFEQHKVLFEESQRFGHFHPDYHAALEKVQHAQNMLDSLEVVRKFKEVEEVLDGLLHTISTVIAHSVSESIKVPGNNTSLSAGGCASGSCSGKCS
jgi:cell fate (sporulation/competence/biofilm development) regulator YlbF (YheA/YmcA/DUF963 family)